METEQPVGHRLSRVSGLVAATGLFAALVSGYLYYQNSGGADVSAELQKPPSPGNTGATASPADAASSGSTQQVAADTGAPMPPAPNPGSETPLPSIEAWRAGTQPQGQADDHAALTDSGNATEPAAALPQNARSRQTSLPTNDFAYVQKSRANIRSKPSVDAKLVGQADKAAS